MKENKIYLRSLNQLNGWKFIIKDYQRGYRWNKQQVEDLLNDLNEFRVKIDKKDKKDNEIYCLQPIIIKKIKDNEYELIDGQQRLTTLYLILKFIRKFAYNGREKLKYDIIYEAKDKAITLEKQKSSYFLNNIDTEDLTDSKNLDMYFMKNAYNTISDWFNNNIDLAEKMNNLITDEENNRIKFICFEINEERNDSEKIFSRINNNQIKLTDSELIKAQILFDIGSNINSDNETSILEQINVSNEWNQMESMLYDDSFWYFLSTENNKDNRTKLIFDFLAQRYDNANRNRKYDTFEKIMRHLKDKDSYKFWNEEVQSLLSILRTWYEYPEIYNYVGYLNIIDKKTNIKEFLDLYENKNESLIKINTKEDFVIELKKMIKGHFKKVNFKDLTYLNDKDKDKIKEILLLFNVITMQKETISKKFPYELYNKYNWEIEHLHPQNEQEPNEKSYRDWINDMTNYIGLLLQEKTTSEENKVKLNKIIKKIQDVNIDDKMNRKSTYYEVTEELSSILKIDMHKIGNLALLDKERNIKFSNKFFSQKREELINDNCEFDTIKFTPICTRNVFLKVYSKNPESLSIWTSQDMINYRKKIIAELQNFIDIGDENNE